MREVEQGKGREREHDDVKQAEPEQEDRTRFSAQGAKPAVATTAEAPERPSASQLAYSDEAKKHNEADGHLNGSWLGDTAKVLGGMAAAGPLGGYAAWKSLDSDAKKPEETKHGEPPKMTSHTALAAPNGAGPERTDVGVGEKVMFKGSAKGRWHAQGGGDAVDADSFAWTAPDEPGHYTITLEVDGQKVEKTMLVVEPQDIQYENAYDLDYNPGVLGAGMMMDMDLLPNRVSFAAVGVKEIPGKAAKVEKFFTTVNSAHKPTWEPTSVAADNHLKAQDRAEVTGYAPDKDGHWTPGKVVWEVPHAYTVAGSNKKPQDFAWKQQSMEIKNAEGDAQTTKAGKSSQVRRPGKPNKKR